VRYRILALDIDGTILDPYGKLPHAVRDAIGTARDRGLQVVLCTGRRFRTALPWARELELEGSIVVHNGSLVKDIGSGETLHEAYLPAEHYHDVIDFVRRRGSPLVYVDSFAESIDILIDRFSETRIHDYQRDYMTDHEPHFHTVDDLRDLDRSDVIMVSTMADEKTLHAVREEAHAEFGARIRTHTLINKNYNGGILEFLSPGSTKWHALERVASQRGVAPSEIVAVGDDTNDIEMIRGAGLGVAMANAVSEVRSAAQAETDYSNEEDGVARFLEQHFL